MRLALHAANQYVESLFPSRQQAFDAGHDVQVATFRTTAFSPYILKEFLIHAGNETTRTKNKTPVELLAFAETLEVENASAMRKQELMFAILKKLAAQDVEIIGEGVVEVLQDGFGFLRSADANYLPGPDDIYISPSQCVVFLSRPVTRSKVRSAVPRKASVILHCSRSIRSISKTRKNSPQGSLRQSDAALPE